MDINCDMGESYGQFKIGNDKNIFPYISSCNIACGFHGGDPLHIEQTIRQAIRYNLRIGAHPSYPDLVGFGRRKMALSSAELRANISYQVAAIKGMVESLGGQLSYVKPHGALYNEMAIHQTEALPVIEAIQRIDKKLSLMGLANSPLATFAQQQGIPFIAEAFADRQYNDQGQLMPRSQENAVITTPSLAVEQVLNIIEHQKVKTPNGEFAIQAQSICVHGDNSAAPAILKALKKVL